ncbi:hypothetical protein RN001_011888 [Aquatica leii]|uniref:cyclin-dependent kinase n=1 Tax=Aquatica leii TaxID=1421715 RepID=A0AAN7P6I3_9COLE|nr:hypothetical protein RN001_011888 [Aquatica leii]
MSFAESGDEQSEDGELRQSPSDGKQKVEVLDFSFSEEDGETADSLDIKPPQAKVVQTSNRYKRRDPHDGKSRHKRSERHREERAHAHREKHHREKQLRSTKDREIYHREKDRYYRDQVSFKTEGYTEIQYVNERTYREHKEEVARSSRHLEPRKKERDVREIREVRYAEKHRRERYVEDKWEKSAGDKALEDLRERLLSKRSSKGDDDPHKSDKSDHRERMRYKDNDVLESVLQGESGMYVKEIINISTGEDKRSKKQDRIKEEDKLTEEERAEQEMRREKLLEAEREMARQKEQSRIERERRHLEKQAKRKKEEEDSFNKRLCTDENNVVTVSDNSDNETNYVEDEDDKSYHSDNSADDSSNESVRSVEHSERKSRSRSRSSSREITPDSDDKSRSRSVSVERSKSKSPKSNGNLSTKTDTMENEVQNEVKRIGIDEGLPPYYPAIQGCRSVEEFQCLNRIEEGTYGVVYRARDKRTDEIVALKRLKMEKEKEGFPITSLREINTLLKGQHPNIVTVREIVVGSNMDKIFIVMDYVEHDLKSLMETMRHKKQTFTAGEVKCLLRQLLCAVAHLHDNWILHRDLKTSNLLLSHKGILKVGDFGLAREYGSPLKAYTPIVVTLWYRAPELLLCTKEYSTPIDMWSVGCIFGELLLMNPVFPGKSEVDQLNRVFKDLGTPNEKIWPGFNKLPAVQKMKFTEYPVSNLRSRFSMLTEQGQSMLQKFLTFDPAQRTTAEDALQHPYFSETPLPIDPSMFPTWPAKSELGHRRALAASPKPPSGGGEYKQLGGDGDEDSLGFRIGVPTSDNRRLPMGPGFSLKF